LRCRARVWPLYRMALFEMRQLALTRWSVALALALLPTRLVRPFANAAGHRIESGVRIGFSLLLSRHLCLRAGARIGHLNLIATERLVMKSGACLGHMNLCKGPFSIRLAELAAIGNRNHVSRARRGIVHGPAHLVLGRLSKITADHHVDLTDFVRFGHYVTLAGSGSQIWTHGYVHNATGPGRYRVDGAVVLSDNVNIGSRSIVTPGVTVAEGITVGAGVTVARSLTEPGFYVMQALRRLPVPVDPARRADLLLVEGGQLVETVFRKVSAD
jgi:acetyltransferase-like isoleucine patch superfamily enzyme